MIEGVAEESWPQDSVARDVMNSQVVVTRNKKQEAATELLVSCFL
jgi:hypothetical protein